jgi:hypothetical protein
VRMPAAMSKVLSSLLTLNGNAVPKVTLLSGAV